MNLQFKTKSKLLLNRVDILFGFRDSDPINSSPSLITILVIVLMIYSVSCFRIFFLSVGYQPFSNFFFRAGWYNVKTSHSRIIKYFIIHF